MKANRVLLVPVLALVVTACSKTEAPPPPAVTKVDQQADCVRSAEAWFKAAYGEGSKALADGRTTKASYLAHFNAQRRECLVQLKADTTARDKQPAVSAVSIRAMGDKAAMIASVVHVRDTLAYCVVAGKKCTTLPEWETAAAPLMKE